MDVKETPWIMCESLSSAEDYNLIAVVVVVVGNSYFCCKITDFYYDTFLFFNLNEGKQRGFAWPRGYIRHGKNLTNFPDITKVTDTPKGNGTIQRAYNSC